MLIKLAFRNIRQSFRDYAVYFLTLLLAIVLFYVSNAIGDQGAILEANEEQQLLLENMTLLIRILSVFVVFVLGFLILYANRFLMKRRSKELGIYLLLGMRRPRVSALFMLETFIIGLISLACGLVLGFYVSQATGVLAGKLLHIPIGSFRFVFSRSAFFLTIICFASLFALVALLNLGNIARLKLIDLLQAGRRAHPAKPRTKRMSLGVFLLSVLALGLAYYLILKSKFNPISPFFTASIILGSYGTYLFFEGFSGILVQLLQRFPRLYYRHLNLVSVRLVNSRLRLTNWLMSVVCILLLLTIGALASGFNIASGIGSIQKKPIAEVMLQLHDTQAPEFLADPEFKNLVAQQALVRLHDSQLGVSDLEDAGIDLSSLSAWARNNLRFDAISQSEYLGLLGLFNNNLPSLDPAKVYLVHDRAANPDIVIPSEFELLIHGRPIKGDSTQLVYIEPQSSNVLAPYLVIPDSLAQQIPAYAGYVHLNPVPGQSDNLRSFIDERQQLFDFNPSYRSDLIQALYSLSGLSIFVTLYLGIFFLISALALLALQQLSENQDNRENYQMLKKLGASPQMINRSVLQQILLYFLLPLALAIVHSYYGLQATAATVQNFGGSRPVMTALPVVGIILAFYSIYLLSTYFNARRIIEK